MCYEIHPIVEWTFRAMQHSFWSGPLMRLLCRHNIRSTHSIQYTLTILHHYRSARSILFPRPKSHNQLQKWLLTSSSTEPTEVSDSCLLDLLLSVRHLSSNNWFPLHRNWTAIRGVSWSLQCQHSRSAASLPSDMTVDGSCEVSEIRGYDFNTWHYWWDGELSIATCCIWYFQSCCQLHCAYIALWTWEAHCGSYPSRISFQRQYCCVPSWSLA